MQAYSTFVKRIQIDCLFRVRGTAEQKSTQTNNWNGLPYKIAYRFGRNSFSALTIPLSSAPYNHAFEIFHRIRTRSKSIANIAMDERLEMEALLVWFVLHWLRSLPEAPALQRSSDFPVSFSHSFAFNLLVPWCAWPGLFVRHDDNHLCSTYTIMWNDSYCSLAQILAHHPNTFADAQRHKARPAAMRLDGDLLEPAHQSGSRNFCAAN